MNDDALLQTLGALRSSVAGDCSLWGEMVDLDPQGGGMLLEEESHSGLCST